MPVLHSNRFVLVDAEGRIRGMYLPLEQGEIDRLLDDLSALEREERRAP
jgi:cytochrome oxidase Cu insertion factor (SCO1/SenC/PrrC family)